MAILDFYQLRRKQRSTDPKTTFLTTIIPTDVLLCLIKHFMKVEGNNEILLKTLKSLQKHYIRIEIYRLMSSQTKISSLELYSTFLQNYKSCRKKNETIRFALHALAFVSNRNIYSYYKKKIRL